MAIHDIAYKIMMVTGVGVSLLNLNPLIKLDGYLIFSELTHETDLKERSTAYLSGLVRKFVFGLPVEIEFVPRRRRLFFVIYAALSGFYGYLLLSFLMVFTYHILQSYTPEWAFVPAIGVGYWVFKARIHTLVKFMKILYLDKKERIKAWLTAPRVAALSAVALLILLLPVWPDFVEGQFVLEPSHKAMVRAEVPGRVVSVLVREGQSVAAGQSVLELSSLPLQSAAAQASADLHTASNQFNQALLRNDNLGPAEYKRQETIERHRTLAEQVAMLQIASPIAGVIASPRLEDLLGVYLKAGTTVAEVADLSSMNARIYIPEFGMRDVRLGTRVRLQPESSAVPLTANLISVAPQSTEIEPGLIPKDQLKGVAPPRFYVGTAVLANNGQLKEGMSGIAKVFVTRRSLAGFAWMFTHDLIDRKIW
jgi:putative peptide zinc metalloprotease protein